MKTIFVLQEIFDDSWTKLENRLKVAENIKGASKPVDLNDLADPVRSSDSKLDEILELLRNSQRDKPVSQNARIASRAPGSLTIYERRNLFTTMQFVITNHKIKSEAVTEALAGSFPDSTHRVLATTIGLDVEIHFNKPLFLEMIQSFSQKFENRLGVSVGSFTLVNLLAESEFFDNW
jgi:hypothetical protein